MITVRRSADRGQFDHGWLDTRHTFSFGEYRDPAHMGFRDLRVINEDRVAPGRGFGTHGHRDMEIITYVLDGVVVHEDSLGNRVEIRPGEVQRMSAGTGVTHSEFNPNSEEALHFLQIWILPRARDLAPGYEQKEFSTEEKKGRLRLVVSPDGEDSSLSMNQDVRLFASVLDDDETTSREFAPGHSGWVQIVRGTVELSLPDETTETLQAGDGASIVFSEGSAARQLRIRGIEESTEFLLFDLPD